MCRPPPVGNGGPFLLFTQKLLKHSVGCSLTTRPFVVDTALLESYCTFSYLAIGGRMEGCKAHSGIPTESSDGTYQTLSYYAHSCWLIVPVATAAAPCAALLVSLTKTPTSWIDDRDDTELDVIAAFLETIVDVPVNSI